MLQLMRHLFHYVAKILRQLRYRWRVYRVNVTSQWAWRLPGWRYLNAAPLDAGKNASFLKDILTALLWEFRF